MLDKCYYQAYDSHQSMIIHRPLIPPPEAPCPPPSSRPLPRVAPSQRFPRNTWPPLPAMPS
ncbi:MAG: hypothetical protein ACK55Z_05185, partial [bacterium]